MSVFEVPTYVTTVPLPAPTTSSTAVFYTDPNGDTWVAISSVNSGAWARASRVLYCRCYRAAAWTTPAAGAAIPMDTAVDDPYGMFSSANGNIVIPIAGLWMAGSRIEISPTAINQTNAHYLLFGGGNMRSSLATAGNATNPTGSVATGIRRMTVVGNAIGCSAEYMVASVAGVVGDGRTYLWAQYMGA